MGFNPRLAPYSITKSIRVVASSKMGATAQNFPIFRFPFAGQLIGAYANVALSYPDSATKDAAIDAATNANVGQVSIWKHAAADVTATYATALRAAIRTGNNDTSTGGGINWLWPTTSGIDGLYSLTNKSGARRVFAAGDQALLYFVPSYSTAAHRNFRVDLQMDYIIGQEDPSA
jgi:hypothetical protein